VNTNFERQDPQKQQFSIWNVMLVLLVTAIIAVGVYLLFEKTSPTRTRPMNKPGDQARAIISDVKAQQGEADFDQLFAQADKFITGGKLEDAYLLLFFAARKGHAPSARVLGSLYDPRYYSPTKSIFEKPDLAQAYKWYKKAKDAGDKIAEERLRTLRSLVDKAAKQGDQEARMLLFEWD
jgi:TPR repeat protein